jgi:predicted lipoprotein with Yx(FWY)xxD motif
MTRSRPMTFLAGAAVIPLAALAVAGCGGGASASTKHPKTTTATTARAAAVRVANSRLGKILVDSRGHTLYLFKKDSGKKSACFGACATFWPPLRASGKPTVGSGASASLIGTTTRSDGAPQVIYNGHPLYRFTKDKKPGDTNGEGLSAFGGRWFAVSPAGKQVSPKTSRKTVSRQAPTSAGSSGAAPPATTPPPPPAPAPAPRPAAPPAPQPSPPSQSNGIPQNGGGDGDADNNGGPSDGDGNV